VARCHRCAPQIGAARPKRKRLAPGRSGKDRDADRRLRKDAVTELRASGMSVPARTSAGSRMTACVGRLQERGSICDRLPRADGGASWASPVMFAWFRSWSEVPPVALAGFKGGSMQGATEASKPHPGRMYDYILGGTYNYEVDRAAADQFVKLVPSIPVAARLNRTFLKVAAARWDVENISHIVDLGSGLPTKGHLNDYMPEAQILFIDRDPLTVEYGREILLDRPRFEYLQLDVLQGSSLLLAMERVFRANRRLGIGFVGLSYFFSDDQVRDLAQTLQSWCAPGSVMAMSFLSASSEATAEKLVAEYARTVNAPLYLRRPDDVAPLLTPWQVLENGPVDDFMRANDRPPAGSPQDGSIRMHGVFATIPGKVKAASG
jgi:O-methyltransferase involved in polyketide biosynthesis